MDNGLIGAKLKDLRTNAGNRKDLERLSRRKFCEKFNEKEYGVPVLLERTLRSWESGQNRPNLNYLKAFCNFFSVDMSYWFDDQRISSKKIISDISDYTGLREETIKRLHDLNMGTDATSLNMLNLINDLMTSKCGDDFLSNLESLKETLLTIDMANNYRSFYRPEMYSYDSLCSWERNAKYDILETQESFYRFIYDQRGARDILKELTKTINGMPVPDRDVPPPPEQITEQ